MRGCSTRSWLQRTILKTDVAAALRRDSCQDIERQSTRLLRERYHFHSLSKV